MFAPPGTPGPKNAPKTDAARARAMELRRDGLSVYEIAPGSPAKGPRWAAPPSATSCARKASAGCCAAPRPRPAPARPTSGRDTGLPAAALDFAALPARAHTTMAGLLLTIPDLVALDLPALAAGRLPRHHGDPRQRLPAVPARPQAHRHPARIPRR